MLRKLESTRPCRIDRRADGLGHRLGLSDSNGCVNRVIDRASGTVITILGRTA